MTIGIGSDGTPPTTIHTIKPALPDGENGYYVSDVEVTLEAADPSIGCEVVGSGVKEIKYKIGVIMVKKGISKLIFHCNEAVVK